MAHGQRLGEHAAEALAILDGRSFSPAFANRLLAPFLLRAATAATGLSEGSALSALILMLLVATLVVWASLVLHRTASVGVALRSSFSSAAGYGLLIDPLYLKPWDSVEYLTFTAFAWAVLTRASNTTFALLFVIALLNRESGLFMAVWLVASGLMMPSTDAVARHVRRGRIAMGLGLGIAGTAFVLAARRMLWAGTLPASPMTPWGNHFELVDNVRKLAADVGALNHESLFILAIPAVAGWLYRARRELDANGAAMVVVLAGIAASNLCFASVTEARTWLVCVPLVVAAEFQLRHLARHTHRSPSSRIQPSGGPTNTESFDA
jgi:hypothetical protein